mmetsp:Transcript_31738/g.62370  ORF Transcript_31738/g.62370 Transcript_31738/m.62370 type:complete len:124 (+) Transcript_31738:416-787(+)
MDSECLSGTKRRSSSYQECWDDCRAERHKRKRLTRPLAHCFVIVETNAPTAEQAAATSSYILSATSCFLIGPPHELYSQTPKRHMITPQHCSSVTGLRKMATDTTIDMHDLRLPSICRPTAPT